MHINAWLFSVRQTYPVKYPLLISSSSLTAAARTFGNSSKTLTDFRSSIDIMSSIDVARHASDIPLQVKVTNLGTETWPVDGRHPTHLSYR